MASGSSSNNSPSSQFVPVSYLTSRRRDRFFRSKPKAAYIAVSCDIYLLSRQDKVSGNSTTVPESFSDFRGAYRYDLSRGDTTVQTHVDGDPCALRVTTLTAAGGLSRAKSPSMSIVCGSERQMLEIADLIKRATISLAYLQAGVMTHRRQNGADLEELRTVLASFGPSAGDSSKELQDDSPGFSSIVTQLTKFSQASKGTARALSSAGEWAQAVGETVAGARGAITVLENVFDTLPIASPIAQVLGLAADIAVLSVERSEKEREMKELAPRCEAIAKDVIQALFFSLDYMSVEDSVVQKLFHILRKCCHVARSAEQFAMKSIALQFLSAEEVSVLSVEVKEIESHVTSLRILQYVQENHARNKRSDTATTSEAFRRALAVSPAAVSSSMIFEESSGTPEAQLKMKLFDGMSTSGLVGAVGMTGIGKTTILKAIAHEPRVRTYFDGGIYEMSVGGGCNAHQVKEELAKAVQQSGGALTSKRIAECDSLLDGLDHAKEWFFGHRCLFVWDDIESTAEAPTGYVSELRSIVDLIVGSRAIFSTRDVALMNTAANPSDVVYVGTRSMWVSERIFCSHANISADTVTEMRESSVPSLFLKSLERLVTRCDGLPVILAVTGKAVALLALENSGKEPLSICKELEDNENELEILRLQAATFSSSGDYEGIGPTSENDLKMRMDSLSPTLPHRKDLHRLYLGLGAVPENTWIPMRIAGRIWDIEGVQLNSISTLLKRFSLLEVRQGNGEQEFRIHSLMHSYCKACSSLEEDSTLISAHKAILRSYMSDGTNEVRKWWQCKDLDDGYLRKNLVRHLVEGRLYPELAQLLLDFRWVQRSMQVEESRLRDELRSLEADYNVFRVLALQKDITCLSSTKVIDRKDLAVAFSYISDSIRLCQPSITHNPAECSFQICGRLHMVSHLPPVQLFIESVRKYSKKPTIWSIRQSLKLAGEPMLQSIDIGWEALSVAFVPDTDLVIAGGHGGAVVIDLQISTVVRVLRLCEKGTVAGRSVAVDERGSRAVCGWTDGTVDVWDLRSPTLEPVSIAVHSGDVAVTFTVDGNHIVVGSEDGLVTVWDVRTGRMTGDPFRGHSRRVTCVAASKHERWIASGSEDHTVRIWDFKGKEASRVITIPNRWIRCIAWKPEMDRIIAGTEQNDMWICSVHDLKPCDAIKAGNWINSVRVCDDGRKLLSASHDGTVQMWDLKTCSKHGEPFLGHTALVTSIAVDEDKRRVVSASYDGTIKAWRLQPNYDKPKAHTKRVSCLSGSPHHDLIASGSYDRTTKLWNMSSGNPLHEHGLLGSGRPIRCVAISHDGSLIASGCGDGIIVVHATSTGDVVHAALKGHTTAASCLSFSLDGSLLASGSQDKSLIIWDCSTGLRRSGPLRGHKNWITSVCFSDNGQLVATGSLDRTVRIWSSAVGECIGEPLRPVSFVVGLKFLHQDTRLEATLQGSKRAVWRLLDDANVEEYSESEAEIALRLSRTDKVQLKEERGTELCGPAGTRILAHLDHEASCEPFYDSKNQRLWVGLADGTVAAVELLE